MLPPIGVARFASRTKCLANVIPATSLVSCRSNSRTSAERFFKESNHDFAKHPYLNLYPWKSLEEFADILRQNIAYRDKDLIILDKPWGIGIHEKYPVINKNNSDIIYWAGRFGDPKFCITDALSFLGESFGLKTLTIANSLDRYESGLMVLATGPKGVSVWNTFKNRARKTNNMPYAHYLAICRGTPAVPGGFIQEKIAIKLHEIDELGDVKVPVVVFNASRHQRVKQEMKTGVLSLRVLDDNRMLATSVVEIGTNSHKWKIVRAYAASKASFILGDVRFASRVKEILGVPVAVSPSTVGNESYEPLHQKVRRRLEVTSNKDIPLLCHLHKLTLVGNKKTATREVYSNKLPHYFDWTLDRLMLSLERARSASDESK